MSSPTTGDISNSFRDPTDLPIYDRTYVLYNYNSLRTQAEAVHNHGHQLESILSYVNNRQDGNTDLWWKKFCGRNDNGTFQQGRCGNTHFPPNATNDYDYLNPTPVLSDCLDWTPDKSGQQTLVNANTWAIFLTRGPITSLHRRRRNRNTTSSGCRTCRASKTGSVMAPTHGQLVALHGRLGRGHHSTPRLYKAPEVKFLPDATRSDNGTFRSALTGDAGFGYEIEAPQTWWTGWP